MPLGFAINGSRIENNYATWQDFGLGGARSLWSWGRGTYSFLGLGNTNSPTSPTQIGALTDWSTVEGGYGRHVAAIKTDGTLWVWGINIYGQLGLGNTTSVNSPVQLGSLTTWNSIYVGNEFTIGTLTNGTLWAWGRNNFGQLGQGNVTDYSSPVQVGTLTNWSTIGGCSTNWIANKTDGTLWGCGNNTWGTLGLGDITHRSSPVQIGSLTNWSYVSKGRNNGLVNYAIKTDGTLWTMGYNGTGELGQNNATPSSSPIQIGSLTTWSSIISGVYHRLALRTDGTLWAWGYNDQGQLGLGNRTYYSSPVQVGTMTNWSSLGPGNSSSAAIKTDGTLWAWGANDYGQLGLATGKISSPAQVGSLTTWAFVSSGQYATFGTYRVTPIPTKNIP